MRIIVLARDQWDCAATGASAGFAMLTTNSATARTIKVRDFTSGYFHRGRQPGHPDGTASGQTI